MASSKKKTYTKESVASALHSIRTNALSIRKASKEFKIPKTTLLDYLNEKHPRNVGAPTVLTNQEEQLLIQWIIDMGERGFPVSKSQIIESVGNLVKNLGRENPFKHVKPGDKWYVGFVKRHPEVSTRTLQKLTTSRARVTESDIRNWFDTVESYLEKENLMHVFDDPTRIFNSDESGFYLSPKEKQVLVKKGQSKVYSRVANGEKECLTVLVTVSAADTLAPPMVLFPYKKIIPSSIHAKYPKNWAIGKTDNGWMTAEAFYEYMTNCFQPWLEENNIQLPVIFFLDGHSSNINLHIAEFCKEKQIILTAFYPNATHCLQPLDVGVFSPLKSIWHNKVQSWRMDHLGLRLQREDFANILKLALEDGITIQTVKNAFRTCDTYLFSKDSIDYSKLIKEPIHEEVPEVVANGSSSFQREMEKILGPHLTAKFQSCGEVWNGDLEFIQLFKFWRSVASNMP